MARRYYRVTGTEHREGARAATVKRPSGLVELAVKQMIGVGYGTVTVRSASSPPPPIEEKP